jgi:bifunctional non-homologous end joining protein LigD
MSLRLYNRKRKFAETPEPKGTKKQSGSGNLRFVVQMHAATRLHFDLRLEFDGVFKSWAVPKGPSLNPLDQRLAVFVEDHPLDYGSFEGIIPKGNYGAGTVMVWDSGTYQERSSSSRKESEAAMKKNFEKGHLTFVFDGKKLKGEFALIKLKKDKSQKAWLLVKKRDGYSTYKRSDVPSDDSVKTGRTLEEIAAQAEKKGDVWLPKKGKVTKPITKKISKITKAALPRKVKPMIATLGMKAADKNWLLEPMVDGLRTIAEVEGKRVSLYSKAGLPFNKKFPKVADELKQLNLTAVLDGEVRENRFYVYDLLYLNDADLRGETLAKRKEILKTAFRDTKHVVHVEALKRSDGWVAKNPESLYKSGTSGDWLLVNKKTAASQKTVATDEPRLTNLDKIYFPEDGITKGDLIEYYSQIAPQILPYLKDRPESMNRFPNGIGKPGFYQKDVTGHIPRWLKTERIFSGSADKSIDYLLCQDQRSLLYMVNLGCIELNPWFSRIGKLENPDFLVIDLDPDDNPFEHVMNIALEVHEILDDVGAINVCKTSGATGIHIGVPLKAKYDFDTARAFAEAVCKIVEKNNPALTSMHRNPNRRRKKIYLDYMQNRRGQTLAAPFCIRPKPGAPVSMPLEWSELKKGLKPEQFNIHNAVKRIQSFDDPWNQVLGASVDLTKCTKLLERKYAND